MRTCNHFPSATTLSGRFRGWNEFAVFRTSQVGFAADLIAAAVLGAVEGRVCAGVDRLRCIARLSGTDADTQAHRKRFAVLGRGSDAIRHHRLNALGDTDTD